MKIYKCFCCGNDIKCDEPDIEIEKGHIVPLCEDCYKPDWKGICENCGASPIVPVTGMCGPCTWGDSDTINGNW